MMTSNEVELDGVLLVDKPSGCTSHDIVDKLRRKLQIRRIGHAGTLDPMATGLLIILVGKATKVSQYLMNLGKSYEARILLGKVTDSHDADGEVLEECLVQNFTREEIEKVTSAFIGDQFQIPPMFSAKKIKGVPLYKMARKGKEVEREPRFIHVSELKLLDVSIPEIEFYLSCSKGTYVRAIAHDIGKKLGCGAHLIRLRRTAIDKFKIEDATTLEKIESMNIFDIKKLLISTHRAVPRTVE